MSATFTREPTIVLPATDYGFGIDFQIYAAPPDTPILRNGRSNSVSKLARPVSPSDDSDIPTLELEPTVPADKSEIETSEPTVPIDESEVNLKTLDPAVPTTSTPNSPKSPTCSPQTCCGDTINCPNYPKSPTRSPPSSPVLSPKRLSISSISFEQLSFLLSESGGTKSEHPAGTLICGQGYCALLKRICVEELKKLGCRKKIDFEDMGIEVWEVVEGSLGRAAGKWKKEMERVEEGMREKETAGLPVEQPSVGNEKLKETAGLSVEQPSEANTSKPLVTPKPLIPPSVHQPTLDIEDSNRHPVFCCNPPASIRLPCPNANECLRKPEEELNAMGCCRGFVNVETGNGNFGVEKQNVVVVGKDGNMIFDDIDMTLEYGKQSRDGTSSEVVMMQPPRNIYGK